MTVESDIERRAKQRVGSVLRGKYKLERLLGLGGMGAVFAAVHQNNRNKVAIKMLHAELSVNLEIRKRFLREGYIANTVEHPGVVRVLDDDATEDGAVFLVLDLLEGETLATRLDTKGVLSPVEVTRIAIDLLDILAAAHEKGIVHRDIKPDNVFLTKQGAVRILDFGIARLQDATAAGSNTRSGHTVGTPAYMAPEQALGHVKKIGPACDVFSVGATMFTLLTGKYTHDAESVSELLVKAATQPVVSIAKTDPNLPASLVKVVDKALAFEMDARWRNAGEMKAALTTVLSELRSQVRGSSPNVSVPPSSDDEIERARTEPPPKMPDAPNSGPAKAVISAPGAAAAISGAEATVAAPTPIGFDQTPPGLPSRRRNATLPLVAGGAALVVAALVGAKMFAGRENATSTSGAPITSAPLPPNARDVPPPPAPVSAAPPPETTASAPTAAASPSAASTAAGKTQPRTKPAVVAPVAASVTNVPAVVAPAVPSAKPKVDPLDRQ